MIYILSSNTYKQRSVIDENVNDSVLQPILRKSQNKVKRLLGTDLYNDILTNIDNGTVTTKQESLLNDYVVNFLVAINDYNVVPFLNYKLTNISLSKKTSDNSASSALDEVKWIRENVLKSEVADLEKEMIDFLNGNIDDYPLFKESRYYRCDPNDLNTNLSQIFIPQEGDDIEFRYKNR
jgi:hypothetical protein